MCRLSQEREVSHLHRAFITKVGIDLPRRVLDALEWIGWEEIIRPGSKVFVKPNLTWPFHKPGVTTSPILIDALLSVLETRTTDISVCESDKSDRAFKTRDSFKGHGLHDICARHGAKLVNLSELDSRLTNEKINGKRVCVPLPVVLLDGDVVLIDVPALKTHSLTGISAGMKNLWGCITDPMRLLYHPIFDEGNAVINRLLNVPIVLIDALYVQDGNGPFFGEPVRMDTIIAANGTAASEAIACAFMGIEADRVSHLALAKRLGILADLSEIEMNAAVEDFRERDFRATRTWLNHISAYLFRHDWANKFVYDSLLSRLAFAVLGLLRKDKMKEDRDKVLESAERL